MRSNNYQVILILIVSLIISCDKIEKLPPVPSIRFNNFAVFDTTDILGNEAKGGRLNFYFEDGDGDLGLDAPSSSQITDTTNLFFTLCRKKNGVMVPAAGNDPLKPSGYRIPFMDRQGQNKILRGNISITFLYLFYSISDTVMYEFYVKDRAENVSNTASTCEIVLNINGICSK